MLIQQHSSCLARCVSANPFVQGMTLKCLHRVFYLLHPGANDLRCRSAVEHKCSLHSPLLRRQQVPFSTVFFVEVCGLVSARVCDRWQNYTRTATNQCDVAKRYVAQLLKRSNVIKTTPYDQTNIPHNSRVEKNGPEMARCLKNN